MDDAIRHLAAKRTWQWQDLEERRQADEEKRRQEAERRLDLNWAWDDARERFSTGAFFTLGSKHRAGNYCLLLGTAV